MASDDDWSEEEIRVCVEQYIDVLRRGGAQRSISKDTFLARAKKQLPLRNAGSIARRMANISHVAIELGITPVVGWKPLANVGPTNTRRIAALFRQAGLA